MRFEQLDFRRLEKLRVTLGFRHGGQKRLSQRGAAGRAECRGSETRNRDEGTNLDGTAKGNPLNLEAVESEDILAAIVRKVRGATVDLLDWRSVHGYGDVDQKGKEPLWSPKTDFVMIGGCFGAAKQPRGRLSCKVGIHG